MDDKEEENGSTKESSKPATGSRKSARVRQRGKQMEEVSEVEKDVPLSTSEINSLVRLIIVYAMKTLHCTC